MFNHKRFVRCTVNAVTLYLVAGCSTFAYNNEKLQDPGSLPLTRATFAVDSSRGNPKILMFLALSGGGSRAAYLSGATMLRLQKVFDDVDLLGEVDVISSVSGGSIAGAYYAVSRDEASLANASRGVSATRGPSASSDSGGNNMPTSSLPTSSQRARVWKEDEVKSLMQRNYLARWILNWFWPENVLKYWFTAYDRSDIMAQTLADNLYDDPLTGRDFTFADLNRDRPFLILNATNATRHNDDFDGHAPFGSVMTFTSDDFKSYLLSDIMQFPVSNAVMASSAFPVVFPEVTMRDFTYNKCACQQEQANLGHQEANINNQRRCATERYMHVFDGGNSDNLGLKSVKRALLELAVKGTLPAKNSEYIIVFLVDAYTVPQGSSPWDADPRGAFDRLLDLNVLDAVDALLQANREKSLTDFVNRKLTWREECAVDKGDFPRDLCKNLNRVFPSGEVPLDNLLFYHFGFDDVRGASKGEDTESARNNKLFDQLNRIPTSFNISPEHVKFLDEAVDRVLTPNNPCLQLIHDLALDKPVDFNHRREVCGEYDQRPGKNSAASVRR